MQLFELVTHLDFNKIAVHAVIVVPTTSEHTFVLHTGVVGVVVVS